MAVAWTAVKGASGIYRRVDSTGRERWRAVAWVDDPERPGKRKQVAETHDTLREAKRWRSDYTGSTPKKAPKKSPKTLEQAVADLHAEARYAPATIGLHRDLLRALKRARPGLLGRRLHQIDEETLREALKGIKAPEMKNKARQLVGLVFQREKITPNPALGVREYKPRTRADRMETEKIEGTYIESGAAERLIQALPDRYRMLGRLMWRVGLRPGEALALTVGKFDVEAGRLTIDQAANGGIIGPTKTGRTREPFLPESIARGLVDHIRRYSNLLDDDALIFATERGKMIELHNWRQRTWTAAVKKAGLEGVRPYDLRHSACSNAIAAGIDVVTVSEMTGHSVKVLLDHYAHFVEEAGKKAAERLDETFAAASA